MTYFWDYIFIPLLVTLGLHGLLAYFLATGVNTESYDLTPMPEVNFVEAKLVEAPKPKKPPKTRQPKAAPKPKVEQLATPNAIPEAGSIPTFDTASSYEAPKVEDDFDISTLFETLKEEELLLQEETDGEIVERYQNLIGDMVVSKWSRPPSARNGMQAILSIVMLPTGQVANVQIIKSSGNSAFDQSAVQAVKQVGRFHVVTELESRLFEEYFREFDFNFIPGDLLL